MHPFTQDASQSVAALGEQKLIAAIGRWLGKAAPRPPHGPGDDCAVLPVSRHRSLVTVDPVIYGEHFDDQVPARGAGAKLMKRNLSDIASMGGRPRAAVIALSLDRTVSLAWLEGFYRGLAAEAIRYGVTVVGGDIAHQKGALAATVTLIGEAESGRVLTRDGARRGDHIFVTGRLGGSLPSLHHWKFTPRLAEGAWLVRRREVRAMTDLSDGLAKDLPGLTPDGCLPAIREDAIPMRRGCSLEQALGDGEDYELLFTVAAKTDLAAFRKDWKRAFPRTPLACIGQMVTTGSRPEGAMHLEDFHGFEHLREA